MSAVRSISARELYTANLRQALIVDVRSPMEYAEKRLAMPTAFAPVTDLNPRDVAQRAGVLEDTPVYTLCASGRRAQTAAAKFSEAGFVDVSYIEGGLAACREAGFSVEGQGRPKTAETSPTLDRQVRFVAGGLTLIFVLLGLAVHSIFFFGALFIGAGQVFSGLTNWCGMAMLLMRAPWNRKSSCSTGSCAIGGGKSPGASCQ